MNEVLQKLFLIVVAISLVGCGILLPSSNYTDPWDKRGYISGTNEWGYQPLAENWGSSFKGDIALVGEQKHYGGLYKAYVGGKWSWSVASGGLSSYHGRKIKIVLLDKTGQVVTEEPFDELRYFYEGMAAVNVRKRWGFIDNTGQYIAKPQFEEVMNFYGGWAAIKLGNKWGFIDNTGNFAISPQFDGARYISEDKARVKVGEKWMYIDKSGKLSSN